MAEIGLPALHPWRGDRPRGRHLRPRGGVHRHACWTRCAAPLPELRVVMEHITTGRRRLCGHRRRQSGRDDHHASPDHQPQPYPRRRHQAALLLPAGRQARTHRLALRRGRDLGRSRASSWAPTRAPHVDAPRNMPAAAPAASPPPTPCPPRPCLRRDGRAGPAGGICQPAMAPPSTGCPERGPDPAGPARTPHQFPPKIPRPAPTVFDPGFPVHWHVETVTVFDSQARRSNWHRRKECPHDPRHLPAARGNRPPDRPRCWKSRPCISTRAEPFTWPPACPGRPISTAAS
jgi:hypothetical protein